MNQSLEQIRSRIKGPVFSIVTPFKEDSEDIDYDALSAYIDFAYKGGADKFFVMAYNSRYSQLSFDEIKALNSFVIKEVKRIDANNLVIVANPLHCATSLSLEFAQHAQECGADLFSVICREKYFSDEQIFQHYKMINDGSDIGILIHEMPFLNGRGGPAVNWPIDLLDRVADLKNVIAIKEDAKDDEYSRAVINKIKDRLGIIISGGGKTQWLQFADDGCQAWLNGVGVYEPKIAVNFWKKYQEKNTDYLKGFVEEIEAPFFAKGVKKFGWHLFIKAALESRGLMSRQERLPMLALSDSDAAEVAALMKSLPIEKYCL